MIKDSSLLTITTIGVTVSLGLFFYASKVHRPELNLEKKSCIYLDYNATTPIHPDVFNAMIPFLTAHFGNPSSSHMYGDVPKLALSKARRAIMSLLSPQLSLNPLEESRIIFTGCGSESDNLAIYLAIHSNPMMERKHIVTSNIEHPAILETLRTLEDKGVVRSSVSLQ